MKIYKKDVSRYLRNICLYFVNYIQPVCDIFFFPKIDNSAFSSCESIEKLIIPEGVEEIDDDAFCNCWAINEIVFPESLKKIGNHTFYYCNSLEKITIPASVEEIDSSAFCDCHSLKEVIIEGSPQIDEYAFHGCRPHFTNYPQ